MPDNDFDPRDFPSLDLVYERIRETRAYQAGLFDALDSKIALLWSVATALVGIVVPFVLSRPSTVCYMALVWVAIIFYGLATITAGLGFFPRKFGAVDDVEKIKEIAQVPRERFMGDSISWIGKQVNLDKKALVVKGWLARGLAALVFLEVTTLLMWAIFSQVSVDAL